MPKRMQPMAPFARHPAHLLRPAPTLKRMVPAPHAEFPACTHLVASACNPDALLGAMDSQDEHNTTYGESLQETGHSVS